MTPQTKIAEIRLGKLAVNIVGTAAAILLCIAGVVLAHLLPHHVQFADWHAITALACLVILVPCHEGLHAIGLRCFAGVHWYQIRFGVMWRALTPYCHCTVPISVRACRRMGLLPLWITGSLTLMLLLIVPTDCFGALAGFTAATCVGDAWIVLKLRSFSDTLLVLDHPSEIGCDIFLPAAPNVSP